jgi:polyadenylate-binding protein
MTRLYVGNLAETIAEPHLYDVFQDFGPVLSCFISRFTSGRSMGFGLVDLRSPGRAQDAVDALDGVELEGRQIKVRPAILQSANSLLLPKRH